ncbi:bifunctional adenosylcobinamide kinase/adenosylcobinamide-phosphate guanylyltransferase [Variovorax defluvii]|uniref:Bifunctional adenosylcobalamin biosynthesis protein n=1 Tax=Variovorax defluvii TaxID=913761 RepID=A0ABP8I898_9BURK
MAPEEILTPFAGRELILGGQRSGKSRRAEERAAQWLARAPSHRAVLIATATAHDEEMRARIARHRADRAQRVPAMLTVEESLHLGAALARHSEPGTLVLVDCLTLWLSALLMPAAAGAEPHDLRTAQAALLHALHDARGPVVLVSNEIGLGVIPLGREVRAFVDALGHLNQAVAQACGRVTLMAAGLPLCLKESP